MLLILQYSFLSRRIYIYIYAAIVHDIPRRAFIFSRSLAYSALFHRETIGNCGNRSKNQVETIAELFFLIVRPATGSLFLNRVLGHVLFVSFYTRFIVRIAKIMNREHIRYFFKLSPQILFLFTFPH